MGVKILISLNLLNKKPNNLSIRLLIYTIAYISILTIYYSVVVEIARVRFLIFWCVFN